MSKTYMKNSSRDICKEGYLELLQSYYSQSEIQSLKWH
jgi:hypothetical protein